MNPWIIIAALWLPLSALAAFTIGPWIRGPHAPAPPPSASPSGGGTGPHPVPGQQDLPVPAHGPGASPPRPAPAPACRWCDGTGWAVVLDHVLEDAYSIACPGGCPIPSGWAVPEVPF